MLFLLNSMVVLGDSVLFHIEHLLLQPPSQEPPIRVQVRGQMTWVELLNEKQQYNLKDRKDDSDTLPRS